MHPHSLFSTKSSPVVNRINSHFKDWNLVPEDKWKIISHVHKSIRHGRPDDAEQGVRWLWDLDPEYLRYRLAVIAQEDVAAGSPELVAQLLDGGWKRYDMQKKGVGQVVEHIRKWSLAVKDRTPCAFLDCAFYLKEFEDLHGSWAMLSPRAARKIAWEESHPWWVRGLAAWRAVGAEVFKSQHLPALEGNWDYYAQEAKEYAQMSDEEFYCFEMGRKTQVEAHPIFFPLALAARKKQDATVKEVVVPDLGYAGPWVSAALDKHTLEGKKALEVLVKNKDSEYKSLIKTCSPAVAKDFIGRLWFWMEGGLLDKQWDYEMTRKIDHQSKIQRLKKAGIDPNVLYQLFGKDLKAWQEARQAVIQIKPAPKMSGPKFS